MRIEHRVLSENHNCVIYINIYSGDKNEFSKYTSRSAIVPIDIKKMVLDYLKQSIALVEGSKVIIAINEKLISTFNVHNTCNGIELVNEYNGKKTTCT